MKGTFFIFIGNINILLVVLTTQCNRTWELFLTHDSLLVFFNHMINVESSIPDPIIRSYLDICETCEILPGKL